MAPTSLILALAMASGTTLDQSLARVPERRAEWKTFIAGLSSAEKPVATYLLTYMPLGDLKALPAAQLREAVQLSVAAKQQVRWGSKLPREIFLDAVAPYASVTEPRQSMRAEFQKRYLPLVKDLKSPGEAALLINKKLFVDYKVTYNTRRLRTDQSPPETIAQGMATCTGLSIMLVDALRAVGVPARLAGIPSWPGRGGNHTWVEVWDNGWHFVGAAEPDDKGLNHAWFAEEAGRVPGDKPMESIYAVTYRPTGTEFPMVWDPGASIQAENVTKRYQRSLAPVAPRLMVEVRSNGERVVADVVAVETETKASLIRGKSLGPNADVNLHLNAPAVEGKTYEIRVTYRGKTVTRTAVVKGDTVVRIDLDRETAEAKLARWFDTRDDKELAGLAFDSTVAEAAWRAFLAHPDPALQKDFDANVVRTADREAPYLWRRVGTKPKDGWGLVIAMHGGGGVPKDVNDRSWRGMFESYYKDQPQADGYIYLALRAPNDVWDGFYDDAISPLIERLILQFVRFGEVDPNQVYACGASHGGYGAFVIAPKIPHRFAAVHSAAAAPTPGRTEGENLKNLRFTWAVGENDTAHNRITLSREFGVSWNAWRAQHGGFDGGFEEVAGRGHGINEWEANKIAQLRPHRRVSAPTSLIWVQTDDRIRRFYWLEALQPRDRGRIEATVRGNTITLKTSGSGSVALWLTPELVDLSKPVTIVHNGVRKQVTPKPSLKTYLEGIAATGDPALSAPVRVELP